MTKHNRNRFSISKTHALDAACVGDIKGIKINSTYHLGIQSVMRGKYQRALIDKFLTAKSHLPRNKMFFGFRGGDIVKTTINGRDGKVFDLIGKIGVRTNGSFTVCHSDRPRTSPHHRCVLKQRFDGYYYKQLVYRGI